MQKYIAVAAALAVLAFVFYKDFLDLPALDITREPEEQSIKEAAWQVLKQYRAAAEKHNLEEIARLSAQLSPTCQDPVKRAECDALMDSVYGITANFFKEDFKHVYADEKQIVMTTDPFGGSDTDTSAQAILYFTRDTDGTPKVLGMRFCFKASAEDNGDCFDPSPLIRDKDKNGWWDEVEARFYK